MRPSRSFAALALILGACTSDSASAPDAPIAAPTALVIADPGLLRDGDVRTLHAEARDATNRPVPNVEIQWATTDPSIAVVTSAGLLTALREGQTEVVAVAGALQQRRLLNVVLHPAMTIELGATQLVLPLGTRGNVQVRLRGLDGRTLLNRPVELTSSDPGVVLVQPNGELIPQKPGGALITVRYGTLSATTTVHVPGEIGATTYPVRDVDGRMLPAIVEESERQDGPARIHEITRIESGTVVLGETYDVTLVTAYYERTVLDGVTTERLLGRQTIRDFGTVTYNWLTGSAALESTFIGGLAHSLDWIASGQRIRFREPGMSNVWSLGLRTPGP